MKLRFAFLAVALMALLAGAATAEVSYQGVSYREDAAYIDLGGTVVKDYSAFEAFLDQMPNLRQVDMWETQIPREMCDRLAARYPEMKWGWTMVLQGKDHKHLIRTDYTSWSTLHNNQSSHHSSEDFGILKYCWNLMALDVGHNSVTDLNFLYDLPNLRVLIVACNKVTDVTPVASLKYLEYAELFNNSITDISCLADLPHILDLNICFNKISDWSALEGLTTLKRLWIYSSQKRNQSPPGEVVSRLKAALPDTFVDSTHYSTAGAWRYLNEKKMHPHYAAIVATFGENHLKPKYEYVPFEDSFPLDEGIAETPAPAAVEPALADEPQTLSPLPEETESAAETPATPQPTAETLEDGTVRLITIRNGGQ